MEKKSCRTKFKKNKITENTIEKNKNGRRKKKLLCIIY